MPSLLKRSREIHFRFRRKKIIKYQTVTFLGLFALAFCFTSSIDRKTERISRFVLGDELHTNLVTEWEVHSGRFLSTNATGCSAEVEYKSSVGDYPHSLDTNPANPFYVALHVLAVIYMFIGLAIVCDEYFEASLAAICEALNLQEDVAGATFMAAGGSAPELFTSIMGVWSSSDIGLGTIIGSATFNVLFVIAMCSFVTDNLVLTWYPLVRDCVFYCFAIIVLVGCAIDKEIQWYESLILLVCYVGYIAVMKFNRQLEKYLTNQLETATPPTTGWRSTVNRVVISRVFDYFIYAVVLVNIVVVVMEDMMGRDDIDSWINDVCSAVFISEMVLKIVGLGFFGYWTDPMSAFDGILVLLILVEMGLGIASGGAAESSGFGALRAFKFLRVLRALRIVRFYRMVNVQTHDVATQTEDNDYRRPSLLAKEGSHVVLPVSQVTAKNKAQVVPMDNGSSSPDAMKDNFVADPDAKDASTSPAQTTDGSSNLSRCDTEVSCGAPDDDDDDEVPDSPFQIPDDGPAAVAFWLISLPLSVLLYLTIPHCRRPMFKKFFVVTFIMCIVWITAMAYVMVWMAVVLSDLVKIPEPVMGLSVLAAGTSVPDLLSSMAVARRGFGDMAVSSSIGSNIFDILIGLPVPWFFKSTLVVPGEPVEIHSDNITVMVLALFIMVACVVAIIHLNEWRLTKKLGFTMVVLYLMFFTMSILLEYGIILC